MEVPRVYIETSIPSFYYTTRDDPESVARKNWTRQWWDFKREDDELVTRVAVLDELRRGKYPNKEQSLQLLEGIPLLPTELSIRNIVRTYIGHRLMPVDPAGDALHLALASYFKCDFLLTWNCKHLANANKFQHIRHLNVMLGLYVPSLVTPLELLAEEP